MATASSPSVTAITSGDSDVCTKTGWENNFKQDKHIKHLQTPPRICFEKECLVFLFFAARITLLASVWNIIQFNMLQGVAPSKSCHLNIFAAFWRGPVYGWRVRPFPTSRTVHTILTLQNPPTKLVSTTARHFSFMLILQVICFCFKTFIFRRLNYTIFSSIHDPRTEVTQTPSTSWAGLETSPFVVAFSVTLRMLAVFLTRLSSLACPDTTMLSSSSGIMDVVDTDLLGVSSELGELAPMSVLRTWTSRNESDLLGFIPCTSAGDPSVLVRRLLWLPLFTWSNKLRVRFALVKQVQRMRQWNTHNESDNTTGHSRVSSSPWESCPCLSHSVECSFPVVFWKNIYQLVKMASARYQTANLFDPVVLQRCQQAFTVERTKENKRASWRAWPRSSSLPATCCSGCPAGELQGRRNCLQVPSTTAPPHV